MAWTLEVVLFADHLQNKLQSQQPAARVLTPAQCLLERLALCFADLTEICRLAEWVPLD